MFTKTRAVKHTVIYNCYVVPLRDVIKLSRRRSFRVNNISSRIGGKENDRRPLMYTQVPFTRFRRDPLNGFRLAGRTRVIYHNIYNIYIYVHTWTNRSLRGGKTHEGK